MMQGTAKKRVVGGGAARRAAANKYEKKYPRGSLIFIEGESSTEMLILRSGKVRILKEEGEKTFELAVLGPGSVLGELSLLDNQPRGSTAQVVEDVTATMIDQTLLKSTMQKIPSWLSNIINVVVKRLRDTMKKTSDDVVRGNVAGAIRLILLLVDSEGFAGEDGLMRLKLNRVKEVVYATIGLGGVEAENIFLHLILKEMLFIRKDELGEEYILVRDPQVMQLYMTYLRTKQRGAAMAGENFSKPAAELLELILKTGEEKGKVVQKTLVRLTTQQIQIANQKSGRGKDLDLDALDEIFASKVAVKETGVTKSQHGAHKFASLVYNKTTAEKIIFLQKWIDVFKEDILF